MSDVVTALVAAKALIRSRKHWVQRDGGDSAKKTFCAQTALLHVIYAPGSARDAAWCPALAALRKALPGRRRSIIRFNDTMEHDDVRALYTRAITAERAKARRAQRSATVGQGVAA